MISRRRWLQCLGAAGALAAAGCSLGPARRGAARVIVVGGGFGGATCARYLRRFAPELHVTLVEPVSRYVTCPFSNAVIGGLREMDSITHGYQGLRALGIEVVRAVVESVDTATRTVTTRDGDRLGYERLVIGPGIDLRYDAVEGYSAAASESIPHAWKAGTQTELLRRQLRAMPEGGVVVITAPGNPYRCPPGPYERASLMANWLKTNNPRAKVIILDAKDEFPKQALFTSAWGKLYPGMIEWVSGSNGGKAEGIDAATRTVRTGFGFPEHRAHVLNVIPPQKAGALADRAGLSDESGWCPVDPRTFESTRVPGVHVIGDACKVGALPKSAYAANSAAKACATAIVASISGVPVPEPSFINTCYSLLAEDYAISVSGVYRAGEHGIEPVPGSVATSAADAPEELRKSEAAFARGWYDSIIADSFAL